MSSKSYHGIGGGLSGGTCGPAQQAPSAPTAPENPIYVEGADYRGDRVYVYVSVQTVEDAYAQLQQQRELRKPVVVTLPRKTATRLLTFFSWDSSLPRAVEEYCQKRSNMSLLHNMLTDSEFSEVRNAIINGL